MGELARREFLKTTPTFGQNLAYFCVESAEGLSLAGLACGECGMVVVV